MSNRAALLRERGDLRKRHDPLFGVSLGQVFILYDEHLIRQLSRHTDVHQRTQDTAFPVGVSRRLNVSIFAGVFFKRLYQIIQALRLIHFTHPVRLLSVNRLGR